MSRPFYAMALAFACVAAMPFPNANVQADEPVKASEAKPDAESQPTARPKLMDAIAKAVSSGKIDEGEKFRPYDEVLKDAEKIPGLIPLYRKEQSLYAELSSSHLNKDYIVLITIARGIGRAPLLGGYSWGFGDDWVWQFKKVGDRVHIVRRNLRFRAKADTPQAKAVNLGYSDSVLFSLPVETKSPSGAVVVDLSDVFMSDLPQIGMVLRGFSFSPSKSTWADIKGFEKNVEIQVAATYASGGSQSIESIPDTRGATVNVHYSISRLPNNGYKPRLADDRVGYFMTVIKDYSKKDPKDRFVRYINRWNLEKAEPSEELSPPKKPIEFWLEDTIPFKYRKPIRDGILEWNKAFEKSGFVNAIEVRQKGPSDTWDPADVRYNTFRWITSGAGFAMGPSRVNPRTGEILDADIIFDADFLQYWKAEYETFTPKAVAELTGGPLDVKSYREQLASQPHQSWHRHSALCACDLLTGKSYDLAFAHAMIAARVQDPKELDKLIVQALKDVTMHEVGHTLGLRHNFKASTLYTLAEAQKVDNTSKTGLTASVMDYTPANIVPQDLAQGDYYSTTIGPYDYWAIEYGYKPFASKEKDELAKIAARNTENGLAFSTDEDTRGIDPDPHSNRWDFSDDVVEYAKVQARLVSDAWPDILKRMTEEGEGFEQARRAFGVLLGTHGRSMFLASRYIGGVHISRSHKGDKNATEPMLIVSADKQREAFKLLEEQVFSDTPFKFPPELYNHLAASHWSHWGTNFADRPDYPAHDAILLWQDRVLARLLSPLTLSRLHDNELKVAADEDAFTTAELLQRLTSAVFAEVDAIEGGEFTLRKPAISSLRRNLQRRLLRRLSEIAMGIRTAPEDCRTVAYFELKKLGTRIDETLQKDGVTLDVYSEAHLDETSSRINKVLEASLFQNP